MGLDQYAYAKTSEDAEQEELAYWRKHNRLHGWMEKLWELKGNEVPQEAFGNDFNCVPVELGLCDLEQLEAVIVNKTMPETVGFFFGDDSYEEYEAYHKENDLNFIENARKAIADGKKVYYDSWW